MSQDAQLLTLAMAYAGAVGKLTGTIRVLIDYGHTYTEQEKIQTMKEVLLEVDQMLDQASK